MIVNTEVLKRELFVMCRKISPATITNDQLLIRIDAVIEKVEIQSTANLDFKLKTNITRVVNKIITDVVKI